ncbi:Sec-independent protein translocase subunit TatA [Aeromicrobium stalagmiti]|uniref:Sec-independent protein translocase subunit TatA n=1 Tax=Aeromicrobium stalagmiti TaxID=2738988 RepID=UPI00156A7249|nr:Sec-independent protein translocase subunit TatA [Aeromicrobium stalagmiti]NRQ50702.1 Sec-independent protein translocase subunit TatA [Aeromicrobium stalagmiti]
MFRQIGPTEILIVLGVVLLLFGGKKLPELARGSGKALRIFKTEVKALHDDDDEPTKPASLETIEATEAPEPSELNKKSGQA